MTRARNLARLVPDTSGLIPNTNLAPIATSLLTGQLLDGQMSLGSVVQVVQGGTEVEFASTLTSYTNPGPSASITPQSVNNKVLALFACNVTTGNYWQDFAVYRNGTKIYEVVYGQLNVNSNRASFIYLDSPSSTSSVSYELRQRSQAGSGIVYMRNTIIILMEIAG